MGCVALLDRFSHLVLLDWAAKGTVLLAIAWIATHVLQRSAAATRHLVWLLAFAGVLLLPVLSTYTPALRVLPDWTATQTAERSTKLLGNEPITPTADGLGTPGGRRWAKEGANEFANRNDRGLDNLSSPAESGRGPLDWRFWIAIVWAAGTAVMLLRLAVGSLRLWRLGSEAQRVEDNDWHTLLHEQAARLGLRRRVTLLENRMLASDSGTVMPMTVMPMTWGVFSSKVLLPAESTMWTAERRRIVLLHELAHIKRWDCAAQWLAHLVRTVHWFNPLAWIAFRQATLAQEQACDDLVLTAGVKPSVYGEQLLAVARGVSERADTPMPAIAMAQTSTFERRMRAILDTRRSRRPVTAGVVVAATVLQLALILPLAALRGATPESNSAPAGRATPESPAELTPQDAPTAPAGEPKPAVEKADDAGARGTIFGTCVDENKKPLAGARVRLFKVVFPVGVGHVDSFTATPIGDMRTDNEGNFRFADVDVSQVGDRRAIVGVAAQMPARASTTETLRTLDEVGRQIDFEFAQRPRCGVALSTTEESPSGVLRSTRRLV